MGKRKNKRKGRRRASGEDKHALPEDDGRRWKQQDIDLDDELDVFERQRERVSLDASADVGVRDDTSDEDDSDNDHHRLDADRHVVFGLDGAADTTSDDDDDDDDDEYSYSSSSSKKNKSKKKKSTVESMAARAQELSRQEAMEQLEEENAEAERREQAMLSHWGKRKSAYYSSDTADFEYLDKDDDRVQAEEEEALRLQKERAMQLEDDEEDEDMLGNILAVSQKKDKKKQKKKKKNKKKQDDKEEEDIDLDAVDIGMDQSTTKRKKKNKQKKKKKSKKQQEQSAAMALLLGSHNSEEASDDDSAESEVERVEKDVSHLTKEQKQQMVLTESPELFGLMDEMKEALNELRNTVQPLLAKVREQKLPTCKGISFLEVKYHLLLQYCINVSFYLYLKSSGAQVKDHPVIKQLAHLRTVMDKIKPIDGKLRYQVEKLLRLSAEAEHAGKRSKAASSSSNPLQFRPNPAALVSKVGEEAGEFGGSDANGDADGESGLYRPPKMTAAQFVDNEKEAARKKRDQDKLRNKMANSSLVRHLREQLNPDRPEEVDTVGAGGRDAVVEDQTENDRREFEEKYFMRLAETREDKQRRKRLRKQRLTGAFEFDDFGELTRMAEEQDEADLGAEASRAAAAMAAARAASGSAASSSSSSASQFAMGDDFDEESFWGGSRRSAADDVGDMDAADVQASEDFYNAAAAKSKSRKAARAEMYKAPESTYAEVDPDQVDADVGRRGASAKILKNRGLMRSRPRKRKHAKTKLRHKYEQALKKRRSQVRDYKGQQSSYGGERTGIKTNVVRSTRLKD